MSSVAGIIVPNNFPIALPLGSVTATSTTTFTNKTLTDPSNNVTAEALWSGAKTNTVNVGNAANPVQGEGLVATGPNTATWREIVLPEEPQTLTNKVITSETNTVYSAGLITNSIGNPVVVSASAPPISGQVLTAISGSQADWETPTAAPPPGVVAEGTFTGTTTASGTYQNIGPQLDISTPGSYMFKAEVVGISASGLTALNGTSYGSFRVQGGVAFYSEPPGEGWTRRSLTVTTPGVAARWKVGDPLTAQLEATVSTTGVSWVVSWQVYFVAA